MKSNYIYVIIYDGAVSTEGYSTIDKAMDHLKKQGYFHKMGAGWWYEDDCGNVAIIKEIKII